MAENKTQPTRASVKTFLASVADSKRRADGLAIAALMEELTGSPPKMWGPTIVGFGSYHYKYASGREGDSPLVGFSPRKEALTLYIMGGFDTYEALLGQLGKHKIGKACLYIKSLEDVDLKILKKLITASVKHMRKTHPEHE